MLFTDANVDFTTGAVTGTETQPLNTMRVGGGGWGVRQFLYASDARSGHHDSIRGV